MFNVLFLVIILWGLILRLGLLNASIDYDEAYSFLYYMKQNLLTCLGQYNISNNHILNSLWGWGIGHVLSPEPWVLRLLPLALGTACLYVVFGGLKVFFDRRTAALASLISWFSFPFIMYSAWARGYIDMVFFFFLGLLMYQKKRETSAVICWALAIWALPTGIHPFFFVMLALHFVKQVPWAQVARLVLKTGVITGGLYFLPMMYVLIFGTKIFTTQEPISLEFYARNFLKTYSFIWLPGWACLLFVLPLIAYLHPKAPPSERRLFLIFCLVIGLIVGSNRSSLEYERIWIWTVPFMLAFLLKLLDQEGLPLKLRRYGFLIFLIPIMVTVTQRVLPPPSVPEANVKALYQDLNTLMKPGDFFLIRQSTVTLVNYWQAVETDQRIQDFQHFFMAGDWKYSLYRRQGPIEVLKEKIGANHFFAVIESDDEVALATRLVTEFVGQEMVATVKSFPQYRNAKLAIFSQP